VLFKSDPQTKIEQNLHLQENLSIEGDATFGGKVTVPTMPISTNTTDAASCAYVKNQNYLNLTALTEQLESQNLMNQSSLMKQF